MLRRPFWSLGFVCAAFWAAVALLGPIQAQEHQPIATYNQEEVGPLWAWAQSAPAQPGDTFNPQNPVRGSEGLRPNDDAVHLCFLVMDPGRRGQGLSRPLIRLTAAAGRALLPGSERMSLNVADGNLRAERLYLSLGFRRNGRAEEGMFQMDRPLGPRPPWDRP